MCGKEFYSVVMSMMTTLINQNLRVLGDYYKLGDYHEWGFSEISRTTLESK